MFDKYASASYCIPVFDFRLFTPPLPCFIKNAGLRDLMFSNLLDAF